MLYNIFYYPSRLALRFYCKQININKRELLNLKGPLLIAVNHPNAFLDAIILASLFRHPVYSLARGDVLFFRRINRLLLSLHILPVYAVNSHRQHLTANQPTFDRVQRLLHKGAILLVFSEGVCVNEWHLRPLKKTTARIISGAVGNKIPITILPAGINYSNFGTFGKTIDINFGTPFRVSENEAGSDADTLAGLTGRIAARLSALVYEVPDRDVKKIRDVFKTGQQKRNPFLLVPAYLGYVLHAPLFFLVRTCVRGWAKEFYDSLMVGLLFFCYPLYLCFVWWVAQKVLPGSIAFALTLIIMPLTAFALLHYRSSFEK